MTPSHAQRRKQFAALTGTGVAVLAAVLVLANLLSSRAFVRLDWTAGGRYSLSDASKRLVRSLPDPVLIRAYISEGLPQPYASQAQYVRDLLREYETASKGQVKLEIFNPESDPKMKEEAQKAGVTPARFTQMASDQFQVREGYLGMVVLYQDKQESFPFLKSTESFEYDLSTKVRQMSRKEKKILGLVTGHGEKMPEDLKTGPAASLHDLFQVESVTLSTASPTTADVLFVMGPGSEFKPEEVAALDRAVSSGTPVALFLSARNVSMYNFSTFPKATGLEGFLAHYGVQLGGDLVFDRQCQQVQIQSRQGPYSMVNIVAYPLFLRVKPSSSHPLTKSLDELGFAFAHPLIPVAGPGLTVTPLAQSSPYSWMPVDVTNVDPFRIPPPLPSDPKGPFTLAVSVEGSTVSYKDPSRPASVRMVVAGTGYFLDNQLPLPPGNGSLLVSLADWLLQDPSFAAIPLRGPAYRPLRKVAPLVRNLAKLTGYFFLPLLVTAWGFWRWRRRRARRPTIQKEWEAVLHA
jgi:gliding-associated putative ABC transporter substrate-binding component GldG